MITPPVCCVWSQLEGPLFDFVCLGLLTMAVGFARTLAGLSDWSGRRLIRLEMPLVESGPNMSDSTCFRTLAEYDVSDLFFGAHTT